MVLKLADYKTDVHNDWCPRCGDFGIVNALQMALAEMGIQRDKAAIFSGMDFTSGQIVLNPGDSREFNFLFGPNIGYGGTEFEYDSSKSYTFRINEDFGSQNILLKLE